MENGQRVMRTLPHMLDYTDVILNLFMAGWFLRLWIAPQMEDADDIYSLSVLLAFEMLMLHSGTFMAFFPPKWSIFIFIPIYGLFAWAYSYVLEDNYILWIYLFVVLNRMRFAFFKKDVGLKLRAMKSSFISTFIYLISLGLTLAISDYLPEFGLTESFLEEAKPRESFFVDGPVFVMAFGTFFYICLAIFNFWVSRNPEKLEGEI